MIKKANRKKNQKNKNNKGSIIAPFFSFPFVGSLKGRMFKRLFKPFYSPFQSFLLRGHHVSV